VFRDAWYEANIQTETDVHLLKFVDLASIWRSLSQDGRERLHHLVVQLDLSGPVAWVCHHLDSLFDIRVGPQLVSDSASSRLDPNSWMASDGSIGRWQGSMYERLFASSRKQLFRHHADLVCN
jgi:hypothetical protein